LKQVITESDAVQGVFYGDSYV